MSDTEITLKDVAEQAQVPLSILKKECSKQQLLLKLATHCVDWELIGKNLGLSEAEIAAVDGDCRTTALKRVGMLEKWKGKFAFKATYQVFVEALLAVGSKDKAVEVCQMIGKGTNCHISLNSPRP